MGVIIDTSAIIELERRRQNWDPLLDPLGDEKAFLPAIVWAELLAGVRLADTAERALRRKEKLDRLRERIPVLPFTLEIVEVWAEIFAELRTKGLTVPSNDLGVISTALFHGHRVLVGARDEQHFRRVARLEVVALR